MKRPLLTRMLAEPASLADLGEGEWDVLIRQARRARLLGRLGVAVDQAGIRPAVPERPAAHLDAGVNLAAHHANAARWELREVQRVLAEIPGPVIALKGAAYVAADLPVATGRLMGDVDILIPRSQVGRAESTLKRKGWVTTHQDAYDQHYYRQWMHELPPMEHVRRGTTLDVHHNILPETARRRPDPAALIAASIPARCGSTMRVLAPADMVLHAAAHLFNDGELEHGLRDLVDLDGLLRHFAASEFWDELLARAEALGLERPLFYALRYTRLLLGTPVPDAVQASSRDLAPAWPVRRAMDGVMVRALAPWHATCEDALSGAARGALYLRGHWLRMPLYRLLPHLLRKTFRAPAGAGGGAVG